jgi:localization factor PodJL
MASGNLLRSFARVGLPLVLAASSAYADSAYSDGKAAVKNGNFTDAVRHFKASTKFASLLQLAILYEHGRGVPKDPRKAYAHYLAAERMTEGQDKARASDGVSRLAPGLTDEQRIGAKRLAARLEPDLRERELMRDSINSHLAREAEYLRNVAVQKGLKRLGFYGGKIDGLKDRDTQSAIRAYQRARGLKVTGLVSESLRRLLMEEKE